MKNFLKQIKTEFINFIQLTWNFLYNTTKIKYTYFSFERRNFYIILAFILFVLEIIVIILLLETTKFYFKLCIIIFALLLFKYSLKFENFSLFLKQLDKQDIRTNIYNEIKKLNKISALELLNEITKESKINVALLEDEIKSSFLANFINTIASFSIGYFSKNTISSFDLFLIIIFFICYLYFTLDIIRTSKLYLIDLYNYQIDYSKTLSERLNKYF